MAATPHPAWGLTVTVSRWHCSAGGEVAGVFRRRWLSLRSMTPSSFWTRRSTIRMLVRHRLLRAACLFRSVDSSTTFSFELPPRTRVLLGGRC